MNKTSPIQLVIEQLSPMMPRYLSLNQNMRLDLTAEDYSELTTYELLVRFTSEDLSESGPEGWRLTTLGAQMLRQRGYNVEVMVSAGGPTQPRAVWIVNSLEESSIRKLQAWLHRVGIDGEEGKVEMLYPEPSAHYFIRFQGDDVTFQMVDQYVKIVQQETGDTSLKHDETEFEVFVVRSENVIPMYPKQQRIRHRKR